MKVQTEYLNFSRAKVDEDLKGRFDLPLYFTGAAQFRNFISNYKGSAKFRSGFEAQIKFEDCAFYSFRFSIKQNYVLVFFENTLRFLAFDESGNLGWVLDDSGDILELVTPYTLAQSRELSLSRNGDVVYIAHKSSIRTQILTRVSANEFTLENMPHLNNDPFRAFDGAISGITNADPARVTTSDAHDFRSGDKVSFSGVGGMTQLNGNSYTINVINNSKFDLVGVDSTSFGTYTSGGTASRAAAYPKNVLFYEGRLCFSATDTRPTTIWMSEVADFQNFNLPTTVLPTLPLEITLTDTSQEIEWMFAGENSMIVGSADTIIALNGGSVNTPLTTENVRASNTLNPGCNSTYPVAKDGNIFYVSADGRRVYFFSYDLLTERFLSQDANILSYDVTKSGVVKLALRKTKDDLIYASKQNGEFLSLNFLQQDENILGWHEHDSSGEIVDLVDVNDRSGSEEIIALFKRGDDYFIEKLARDVDFEQRSSFFTDDKKADDLAYGRYVTEQLKETRFLDAAVSFSNLRSETITFDPSALTITSSGSVFAEDDIGNDIVYRTATGYEYGRFKIASYSSATVVGVEVTATPHSNTYSSWYKTFRTVSGLDDYEGRILTVVIDGAFSGTAEVVDGEIVLEKEAAHVVVGFPYTGIVESFPLGFRTGNLNTQVTPKAIRSVWLRLTSSASGKVGSDRYRLTPVQKFPQGAVNYSPLVPLDKTVEVNYVDVLEVDKRFVVVQNEPAPFYINSVMIDASYGNSV